MNTPEKIIEEWLTPIEIHGIMSGDGKMIVEALDAAGYAIVPKEPTEAMLIAARDWSLAKYGRGVGNDGAEGCWKAMIAAAQKDESPPLS